MLLYVELLQSEVSVSTKHRDVNLFFHTVLLVKQRFLSTAEFIWQKIAISPLCFSTHHTINNTNPSKGKDVCYSSISLSIDEFDENSFFSLSD